jgi:sugar lactone lactonase YvrE
VALTSGRPRLSPVVWNPPARSARARAWRAQLGLPEPVLIPLPGAGPEDVVVDAEGRLLCGVADGRILRVRPDGQECTVVGDIAPGRPAGLEVLPDGRLLVCDARLGRVLRLHPDRPGTPPEVLADSAGGEPLRFCSNVVAAADGTVYLTESSRRFTIDHWRADLMEHSGTGRLLRLDPEDPGSGAEVLLEGLQFANGLALGPEESFLAVAETGAYRVTRYWLAGDRQGSHDTLVDLPGFPDNMSADPGGELLWIAMVAPRDPLLDLLHRTTPVLRRALWRLPDSLLPGPAPTAWVIAVDAGGRIVHDLARPGDRYRAVTGVCASGDRLYLGSLTEPTLAVADLSRG